MNLRQFESVPEETLGSWESPGIEEKESTETLSKLNELEKTDQPTRNKKRKATMQAHSSFVKKIPFFKSPAGLGTGSFPEIKMFESPAKIEFALSELINNKLQQFISMAILKGFTPQQTLIVLEEIINDLLVTFPKPKPLLTHSAQAVTLFSRPPFLAQKNKTTDFIVQRKAQEKAKYEQLVTLYFKKNKDSIFIDPDFLPSNETMFSSLGYEPESYLFSLNLQERRDIYQAVAKKLNLIPQNTENFMQSEPSWLSPYVPLRMDGTPEGEFLFNHHTTDHFKPFK